MYNNFEVLEAKCKKYHFQKMLKIVVPFLIVLSLVGIGLFYFLKDKAVKAPQKQIKKIEKKDDEKVIKIEEINIEEVKEPDIFEEVKPKQKIEDVKYNLKMYSYNLLNKKREHISPKIVKKVKKEKSKVEVKPKIALKPKVEVKEKSFSMTLKKINSVDKMIELYNSEKSYTVAIKIAKLFYAKKEYKKALLWSKKANNIDAREEESWLIYAKSEYALGHKKKAKGILKVYINNSNSQEAKDILISWIKGN